MLTSEKILIAVQVFVLKYLKTNLPTTLSFHNVNHTLDVVQAVKDISTHYNLSDEHLNRIKIAAWFHDCGYAKAYTGHESVSKQIAEDFLKEQDYPESEIAEILSCIEATRYPQNPMSVEAKILCDADLYHFTKPDYHRYELALRLELEYYFKNKYSDSEWARINCKMLETHEYFTEYGREKLQKFKAINVVQMRCRS